MGSLTVKYINVNKDAELDPEHFNYDSAVYKIMTALQDMKIDAIIVRVEQYEGSQDKKVAMIRKLCNTSDSLPDSFVICADAYVSTKEFPLDKYYNPIFFNIEEIKGKKTLPFKEVIDRERKMLEEIGFESINEIVQFKYWDAMIYTNDIGKKLITYWFGETINGKRGK